MERRGKVNVMDGEGIPSIPEKALFESMSSLKKQCRNHYEISSQIALTENAFIEQLGNLVIFLMYLKSYLS